MFQTALIHLWASNWHVPENSTHNTGSLRRGFANTLMVIVYVDDILISRATEAEHLEEATGLWSKKHKFVAPINEFLGHLVDDKGTAWEGACKSISANTY